MGPDVTTNVGDFNSVFCSGLKQPLRQPPRMETLSQRVKARREAMGLSQSELARRIGVAPQTIQSLESGRTRNLREVVKAAEVLAVTPRWLATGQGEKGVSSATGSPDLVGALEDFAIRIKEARAALGFQPGAASRAIMAEDQWLKMDRAEYWPDPVELDLICGRLAQSLDWLVRGVVIASGDRPVATSRHFTLHDTGTFERGPRKDRES